MVSPGPEGDNQEHHENSGDELSPSKDDTAGKHPSDPDGLDQAFNLPRGVYKNDTFFDRVSAYHSPESVKIRPEILESQQGFNSKLQRVVDSARIDYPDADLQCRLSDYLQSKSNVIFRTLEMVDKDGAFYLPAITALEVEEDLLLKGERFESGAVHVIQRLAMEPLEGGDIKLMNVIDVYYEQDSLEEAVEHMREALQKEQKIAQNSAPFDAQQNYSHLKAIMHPHIMRALATLDEEQREKLFQGSSDLQLDLLDLETRPLPNGLTLTMAFTTPEHTAYFHTSHRLTLDQTGKLTIEHLISATE